MNGHGGGGLGVDAWVSLASKGVASALSGLSQSVGEEVRATALSARRVLVKDAASLVGGPETAAVGVYLGVGGDGHGHLFLLYPPAAALGLVDMLLEQPSGTAETLGEMEQSALGEVGNIMGSFFLNALAEAGGLSLRVTPPAVIADMVGAVLDAALAEMMEESEEALVVEATFGSRATALGGTFLVLPGRTLQAALLGRGEQP